jgi:hypothetical protein
MALALTGRPIPNETPHQESRGQRMSDGTAATLQVRAYADPDLEALRIAITDAAVLHGWPGRAVNRTAETPLALFILADGGADARSSASHAGGCGCHRHSGWRRGGW